MKKVCSSSVAAGREVRIASAIIIGAALLAVSPAKLALASDQQQPKETFEQYARGCAVPRDVINAFLAGPAWAKFDPELGYVQQGYVRHDAMGNTSAIYTFGSTGARTSFVYASNKPRINAYGDSFTESEQVNDGETWEEYLAGHLAEPIGNYGIGGYGVYQAYRRMIREEKTEHGAEYLIFYIWGDDPTRSLLRSRYCAIYPWFKFSSREETARNFHGQFWAHVEMDLQTGRFVERESPMTTTQALYHMADQEWMLDHLKDDLALQLAAYADGRTEALDRKQVSRLAATLEFPFDWTADSQTARLAGTYRSSSPMTPMQTQAAALLNRYSQRANIFILEKVRAFANQHGKKLLIVIFDPYGVMQQMHNGVARSDQETLDYLVKQKFDYIDMNEVQLRDFKKYNLSWEDYQKQYFIGHYSPVGNHFFAYSIADRVANWLSPKPITYRNPDASTLDFEGYLHGSR